MAVHFQDGSLTWFAVSEVSPPDLVVSLLLRAVKHILWGLYFMVVVKLAFTETTLQKRFKTFTCFLYILITINTVEP